MSEFATCKGEKNHKNQFNFWWYKVCGRRIRNRVCSYNWENNILVTKHRHDSVMKKMASRLALHDEAEKDTLIYQ